MAQKSDWCIVALPEETNPVYKVSSEKVPHLTLLFLGEQSEPALAIRMIETIQHTIETSFQSKFSLGVERRGTLGKDQADVLFFYKDDAGRVGDFRSLLLKNDDIKTAYDSTEQFPEWTPHLTLGYPDRPAKPIPDDNHSISWITFDRIALWLEDSDGPEIRLGNYDSTLGTPDDAYHTDQMIQRGRVALGETEDFLSHYGVKGMKWGVRRSQAQLDRAAGRTTSRKQERRNASVAKQTAKMKKQAASYKMKRGSREELLKEREKVQKKLSSMDPDKMYNSMGRMGAANPRKAGHTDSSGKTAFQNLTAREKHNVNQLVGKKLATKYAGMVVGGQIITGAAAIAGMEGYMKATKVSPKTRDQGRKATAALVAYHGGKKIYQEVSAVRTEYKFRKLEDRRLEIDRQLARKW